MLEDRSSTIAARRLLVRARSASTADAARLAAAEIARREARHESYPEGHLQLGLALEQCGQPAEALAALRTARNLYEDETVWRMEQRRDPAAEEWRRQARYHFGRMQYTHGDRLNEALAALRAALRQQPDDPRVLRTLAQAMRALVEQDLLVEATDYVYRYLNAGAPLGSEADLVNFAVQRQQP